MQLTFVPRSYWSDLSAREFGSMRRYPEPCYESGASVPVFNFVRQGYE